MKATLTNKVASNYTVENFKVKKLFWFLKIRTFFNIIVDWIPFFTNVFTSLNFLNSRIFKNLYYNHYL